MLTACASSRDPFLVMLAMLSLLVYDNLSFWCLRPVAAIQMKRRGNGTQQQAGLSPHSGFSALAENAK
jgi:hypothetical protein